ncbi:MAG: hypothetical protein ACREIM_08140 [Nitrospiraceae bacterium]
MSSNHVAVAAMWARTKIDDLAAQDYDGLQTGKPKPGIRRVIRQLGLDHGLVTAFTSFVAVEEMTVTDGGEPRRVEVPVEMPEGVNYEGVFGQTYGEPVPQQLALTGKLFSPIGQPFAPAPLNKPCPGCSAHRDDKSREARKPLGPAQTLQERLDRDSTEFGGSATHPLNAKVHPVVLAVVSRLEDKTVVPSLVENEFVRKGVAEIQIWLTDTSDTTLDSLHKLGVTIFPQPKTGKVVLGRVAAEELAKIAALKTVRYLAPHEGVRNSE